MQLSRDNTDSENPIFALVFFSERDTHEYSWLPCQHEQPSEIEKELVISPVLLGGLLNLFLVL